MTDALIRQHSSFSAADALEDNDEFDIYEAGADVPNKGPATRLWDYVKAKIIGISEPTAFANGDRILVERGGDLVSVPSSALPSGGGGGSGARSTIKPLTISGTRYFPPLGIGTSTSPAGSPMAANEIQFFLFREPLTFDGIGVEVPSAITGGHLRIGIYDADDTTGLPGALIEEGSIIDTSVAGTRVSTFAGTYDRGTVENFWIAALPDVASTLRGGVAQSLLAEVYGTLTPNSNTPSFIKVTQAYGALPASLPSGWSVGLANSPNMLTLRRILP